MLSGHTPPDLLPDAVLSSPNGRRESTGSRCFSTQSVLSPTAENLRDKYAYCWPSCCIYSLPQYVLTYRKAYWVRPSAGPSVPEFCGTHKWHLSVPAAHILSPVCPSFFPGILLLLPRPFLPHGPVHPERSDCHPCQNSSGMKPYVRKNTVPDCLSRKMHCWFQDSLLIQQWPVSAAWLSHNFDHPSAASPAASYPDQSFSVLYHEQQHS